MPCGTVDFGLLTVSARAGTANVHGDRRRRRRRRSRRRRRRSRHVKCTGSDYRTWKPSMCAARRRRPHRGSAAPRSLRFFVPIP